MPPADLETRPFDRLALRSLRDFIGERPPDTASLADFRGLDLLHGRPSAWRTTERGLIIEMDHGPLRYSREVTLHPSGGLQVVWRSTASTRSTGGWFGTLLCLTLLARRAEDRSAIVRREDGSEGKGAPGDPIEEGRLARLTLEDHAFGFALDVVPTPTARLVACPIETVQRSEDRLETTYQGTIFALCWPWPPREGPPRAVEVRLAFRRLT